MERSRRGHGQPEGGRLPRRSLAAAPGPGELFQLSWDTRIPENGPHDVRLTARNPRALVLVCDNPTAGVAVLVTPRGSGDPGDAVAFQATVLGTQQDVTWWYSRSSAQAADPRRPAHNRGPGGAV